MAAPIDQNEPYMVQEVRCYKWYQSDPCEIWDGEANLVKNGESPGEFRRHLRQIQQQTWIREILG